VLGPPGPARHRFEWLGWFVAGGLLAVSLTWPLVRHLGDVVPQDAGDPLGQAWFLAWPGHALRTAPTSLFNANTFWPSSPSYAFSDTLLGYLPASLVGAGVPAAIVRYDLVFLFAYTVCFAAAALLARELGCRPTAAALAGVAYAWAPWRMTHNGHLNVLSTGGVALTLFLLTSGYRRGRAWQVLAGWAAAAWQLTLGFALGIWFAYLLAALSGLAALVWLWRGRRRLPRALVVATGAGGALLLAVTGVMVRPYLAILSADPSAARGREQVAFYSPPLRSLLAAPAESRAWGEATQAVRESLPWPPEQVLFPGLVVTVLALVGLRWAGARRGLRLGLAGGTALVLVLSLGLTVGGGLLYDPLLSYAPGWQGLRTPGRLAFLWSLGLALLAAFGAQQLADAVARRTRPWLSPLLALALTAAVAYEGAPALPLAPVPARPAALNGLADPVLHLPSDSLNDTAYMLWSTDDFTRIGNGSASYLPPALSQLRNATAGFPDAASVDVLRALGFRTVVLHRSRLPGTPWDGAADRSTNGLDLTRTDDGDVVVYGLW